MSNEIFGTTLTPQVTTGNPATVNDATARIPVGTTMRWKGNKWMYVKFDNGQGNVASAAGGTAYWKTLTPAGDPPVYTVTSDQTDSIAGRNGVAGIFGGVITDGHFCWIQISGVAVNGKVTATTDANDLLCGSATDLVLQEFPATYDPNLLAFGIALGAATTAAVVNILLQNLDRW